MNSQSLRALLSDTSWALVITDLVNPGANNSEAAIHTSLRIRRLQKAGLTITAAGVLQDEGYISPGMFIHNISSAQLDSMLESQPPLLLCPSFLYFRSGLTVHPDLSTLSIYQGSLVKESTHLETHIIQRGNKKDMHIGMFSDLNLYGVPTDDPSIPFSNGHHHNAFLYSARSYATPERVKEDVQRLCNIRSVDFDESIQQFTREISFNRFTARTTRIRKIITEAYVKHLKSPQVFGYRYRDKEGSYV